MAVALVKQGALVAACVVGNNSPALGRSSCTMITGLDVCVFVVHGCG